MQQRTNMADCRHLKHLCMPFYGCLLRTPCVLSAIELLRKISKATPARWHIIQKGNSMTSWYSVLLPSLSSPACTVQCADAKTNCYHGMQQIPMSADAYCEAGEEALEWHSKGLPHVWQYDIYCYSHSLRYCEATCTTFEIYSDIEMHSLVLSGSNKEDWSVCAQAHEGLGPRE